MRFWVPDTGRNEMRASANTCYLPMDRFRWLRRVLSLLRPSIRQAERIAAEGAAKGAAMANYFSRSNRPRA